MPSDASEVRRLAASLASAGARTRIMAQGAVRKTAKDIERTAKNLVPVGKSRKGYIGGNLKNSIGTSDLRNVGQSGSLSAEVGPTAEYGGYVEFGTSRMAPQPYMGPAADVHLPLFEQAVAQLGMEALGG
jgi:HK97 gp10 family phage protein